MIKKEKPSTTVMVYIAIKHFKWHLKTLEHCTLYRKHSPQTVLKYMPCFMTTIVYLLIHGFMFSICQLIQVAPLECTVYLLIYKINAYLLCCSIRYSVRMNLAKPVRNVSSTHAALTRSSHYSVIGALVGTLTGLGLVFNKQKVLHVYTWAFVKKHSIFLVN